MNNNNSSSAGHGGCRSRSTAAVLPTHLFPHQVTRTTVILRGMVPQQVIGHRHHRLCHPPQCYHEYLERQLLPPPRLPRSAELRSGATSTLPHHGTRRRSCRLFPRHVRASTTWARPRLSPAPSAYALPPRHLFPSHRMSMLTTATATTTTRERLS